ncbi:MAG: DNA pilot protein [Arizlama microvirus]|nr:MAG: DNA pilot protein [Arizlama microvirus]
MSEIIGGIIAAGGALAGSGISSAAARDINNQNIALQREFATNGIRMKVEDAKRAGIHPLAALGAQTYSFSPVNAGDTSIGQGVSDAGQAIGRAVSATRTDTERQFQALQLQNLEADLRGKEIDNAIRASNLVTARQGSQPPFPSASGNMMPGQGNSPVVVKPSEVVASSSGNPAFEPGVINSISWQRTPDGGVVPVQSSDSKQRTEDDFFSTWDWNIRNRVLPAFRGVGKPSPRDVHTPPGTDWYWNPVKQAYYLDIKAKRRYHDRQHPFGWKGK